MSTLQVGLLVVGVAASMLARVIIRRRPAEIKIAAGSETPPQQVRFQRHAKLVMDKRFGDGELQFDDVAADMSAAHQHSMRNRTELLASDNCGCFYCLKTYAPSEIKEWIDDKETATCPRCGIDSVLGSKSGLPLNDDFLKKMNEVWF